MYLGKLIIIFFPNTFDEETKKSNKILCSLQEIKYHYKKKIVIQYLLDMNYYKLSLETIIENNFFNYISKKVFFLFNNKEILHSAAYFSQNLNHA